MPSNLPSSDKPARREWVLTPKRRAASRRNVRKARRAVLEGGRPFTEAMLAASRQNLARAREVLKARGRSPEHLEKLRQSMATARLARTRASLLKQARSMSWHGYYARLLRDTAQSLGEDPADYDKLRQLVANYLNPQGAEEMRLARLVGDALWRFHRLYLAQARQQLASLLFYLGHAPPLDNRYASHLENRAYLLVNVLLDQKIFQRREWRHIGSIERLLRRLIRMRGGSLRAFPTRSRPRGSIDESLDRMSNTLDRQSDLFAQFLSEDDW